MRFRHLMITNVEKVAVLKQIAGAPRAAGTKAIKVFAGSTITSNRHAVTSMALRPCLMTSLTASGRSSSIRMGDAYNSGDEYRPEGYMGNVFRQSLTENLRQ